MFYSTTARQHDSTTAIRLADSRRANSHQRLWPAAGRYLRTMGGSDTDQIAAFEERFARAQTTDVIDLPWGFVLLQRDFPSSHDHNRAVVTSTALSADILSTVDDAMGGAGLQHRQISVIDDALGLELSDDFTAAGDERETITTMIYRGGPDGPQSTTSKRCRSRSCALPSCENGNCCSPTQLTTSTPSSPIAFTCTPAGRKWHASLCSKVRRSQHEWISTLTPRAALPN